MIVFFSGNEGKMSYYIVLNIDQGQSTSEEVSRVKFHQKHKRWELASEVRTRNEKW